MLIEIALSDSLGAPYEFSEKEKRSGFKLDVFATHDGIGRYTDDTQMSIAVCEHMLANAGEHPHCSQEEYAEYFLEAYRRDPRQGYSRRTRTALSTSSPRRMIHSAVAGFGPPKMGNGAVMRCVPLGMYPTPEEVMGHATMQSGATHPSIHSAIASCMVALTSHYIYHRWESPAGLTNFLREQMGAGVVQDLIKDGWSAGEVGNESFATASYCIKSAVTHIKKNPSVSAAVSAAVALGGDVDSTCCITTGLMMMHRDMVCDLPEQLMQKLENGPFGRNYIIALDGALARAFPRN